MATRAELRTALRRRLEDAGASPLWDDATLDDALVGALAARLPGRPLRLSNEPAESPLCAALERLGWQESLRQDEMRRSLP